MCERREGEDFEAYRARRKVENKYAKNATKPFSVELVNNELTRVIHKRPGAPLVNHKAGNKEGPRQVRTSEI